MDWRAASGLPPNIPGTVLTIGTFDGVHRGHRLVLDLLATRAAETGLRSVLVTFDSHPLEIVNPAAAPMLLTTAEEKSEVLVESRLDYAVVYPFTRTLAAYDATQFVDEVLLRRLGMRELLVGYDHGFGRGRSGDADVLRELGAARGFQVTVVPPVQGRDGRPISSTSIRRAIAGGDLARATDGLARPYAVSGSVTHGKARGRTLGFRTINVVRAAGRKLMPPEGVYAVLVQTGTGSHEGMVNLGPRPTFDDPVPILEAHLFDTDGDWYGQRVRIDFVRRLRDVTKFANAEALVRQLGVDEQMARSALRQARVGL